MRYPTSTPDPLIFLTFFQWMYGDENNLTLINCVGPRDIAFFALESNPLDGDIPTTDPIAIVPIRVAQDRFSESGGNVAQSLAFCEMLRQTDFQAYASSCTPARIFYHVRIALPIRPTSFTSSSRPPSRARAPRPAYPVRRCRRSLPRTSRRCGPRVRAPRRGPR